MTTKDQKDNKEQIRPTCFVIMPIADIAGYEAGHFGRVYEYLLKPAIIAAGYTPVRADDAVKTDYIVVGIIQKIVESSMVICDFSARNPNVMYELGIRHAFNKPVVLIKDRRTEKIFDIQGLRYTEYDETLRIDAVNKDVSKITTSITETASSDNKDLNSVVQLAGIKAADVPAGQTVSADTKLLLSAIGSLESRISSIETREKSENTLSKKAGFVVYNDHILLSEGSKVDIGETLYINGKAFGTLEKTQPADESTIVRKGKLPFKVSATAPSAFEFSIVPF